MKKKNLMSKVLVLALALVMVFTMTASAFATGDDESISVNVTIDTRTLSRSDVLMRTTNGTALGTSPVVTTTVTVPEGSDVLDVLNAAKNQLGFEVISEASSYGGTFVTDIAGVGEKSFVGDKVWDSSTSKYNYQFTYTSGGITKNSLFTSEAEADDYLLFAYGALCSGWVYSVNGYYPDVAMDLYTNVTANCNVNFRYTVTGSYDVGTSSFPTAAPYTNWDCEYIDTCDQLLAIENPDEDQEFIISSIEAEYEAAENATTNIKGWTSPYYLNTTLAGENGSIEFVNAFIY